MRGNDFIFNRVHLLYSKCHKINLNCGGSYIDCPDWIKNEKAIRNAINKINNECFQYTVTFTLSHEIIGTNPEKIINIEPFINKYDLEEINYPSEKND